MNNYNNEKLIESVLSLESAFYHVSTSGDQDTWLDPSRKKLRQALKIAGDMADEEDDLPLSSLIEQITKDPAGRRDAAIIILRTLSIDGLLHFEADQLLQRRIVELVEVGFGDQLRSLRLSEKRQTFEKLNAIRGFHEATCRNMQPLLQCGSSLRDISAFAPDIQRVAKNGALGAYLNLFGWSRMKGLISQICEQATDLHNCHDATYQMKYGLIAQTVADLNSECERYSTFLPREFVLPFVRAVDSALKVLKEESQENFACDLEPRRKQPEIAAKRYPLHIENKWLTVTIPFVNKGPGVAVDVYVELDGGSQNGLALEEEVIRVGDIPPGDFAIAFRCVVVSPKKTVQLAMQLNWGQLFGETKSSAIDIRLIGQDTNTDWGALELLEPYSLEVADADRFVGRKSKVQAIGNRLLRAQMSSTYITGQKRIGKTSLAQAVIRYIEEQAKPPVRFHSLYQEWGEYSNADPAKTVEMLGQNLFDYLCSFLPQNVARPSANFCGSIAPLNGVARLLEQYCPNERFVFALDEFDEIHPEMYRYGPLAEAFFSNLRTLSAKRNLAFVLVGGEKMPFIIGAQGDQLNKFVREPLDYFSRSDEWEDYVELVKAPVRANLNWQENSITELFNSTAGHPYYTKLVCSKVFATAVVERDTEVIAADVRRAINQCLSELDTNAFAHFWKDGLNGERDEAEVIELKRLRVLVAFGRAARLGNVTRDSVIGNLGNLPIDSGAVNLIIDDFLRRDVLRESSGTLTAGLPLFQRWLADVGVTKLIASTLADDLEAEIQKANDEAHVQSAELTQLVRDWPLYRGREITAETVRAWLDQVPHPQEQRLLFKLLGQLQFITPIQIAELLRTAHFRAVVQETPLHIKESKIEKRRDLLVTYVDGPGKSGAYFARAYAKEIGVLLECVVEPSRVLRKIGQDDDLPSAIVIVDDLAGTGTTITDAVEKFLHPITEHLERRGIPVVLVLLFATEDAELKLRKRLSKYDNLRIRIFVGRQLGDESKAFPPNSCGIWKDENERNKAKSLCQRLGAGLYKDSLGFGSQALLISFPEGCPNNNLPIIFASRAGNSPWAALLPRPAS